MCGGGGGGGVSCPVSVLEGCRCVFCIIKCRFVNISFEDFVKVVLSGSTSFLFKSLCFLQTSLSTHAGSLGSYCVCCYS